VIIRASLSFEEARRAAVTRNRRGRLLTFVGLTELGDVELLHLEHRLHRPPRLLGVAVHDEPGELDGRDLPRETEAVLEPAALLRLLVAARAELRQVAVDLVLRLAHDLERDRFVELE